jgi:membrane-bound lytic murein transglycosylase B
LKKISLLLLLAFFVPLIHLDYSKSSETLSFIDEMVSKHSFERSYLVEIFKNAEKREKIINSMNRPAEKKFSWLNTNLDWFRL